MSPRLVLSSVLEVERAGRVTTTTSRLTSGEHGGVMVVGILLVKEESEGEMEVEMLQEWERESECPLLKKAKGTLPSLL